MATTLTSLTINSVHDGHEANFPYLWGGSQGVMEDTMGVTQERKKLKLRSLVTNSVVLINILFS